MGHFLHIGYTKMEIAKISFVIVVLIVVFCLAIKFSKQAAEYHNSRTYVYPKTGHKYYLEEYLKSKNPDTGEWYLAVRYFGINDQKYYVREHDDFFNKFIPLNKWKDGTL